MSSTTCMGFILGVATIVLSAVGGPRAYAQAADPNSAPNTYRAAEDWVQLPEGRKMGQPIGVEVDRDGKSLWVFDRCGGTLCTNSNLAPIMHFDASGKFLGAIGADMFVFPHGLGVDHDGNVYVTDARAKNGKG